jgi:hypothetical protein
MLQSVLEYWRKRGWRTYYRKAMVATHRGTCRMGQVNDIDFHHCCRFKLVPEAAKLLCACARPFV